MNKKGSSILDLILILVILFVVGVGSIFIYKIFDSVADEVATQESFDQDIRDDIVEQADAFPTIFDNIFLIILIGFAIALFIGAFFLNTHPVFFIFSVIVLGIVVILAAALGNSYESIVSNSEIITAEGEFTIIPWVFDNFTVIMAALGVLLLVGLYAKGRSEPI